jgi:hypothetical protein
MLAGIVRVLYGRTTCAYINSVWDAVAEKGFGREKYPAIHICRVHTVRFIFEAVDRCYVTGEDVASDFWCKKWTMPFLRSSNMASYCRRLRDLVLISGSQYLTAEVQKAISGITERTTENGIFHTIYYLVSCVLNLLFLP